MNLLAIAATLPALATTAAGGATADTPRQDSGKRAWSIEFNLVTSASAAEQGASGDSISLTDGFKQFFGVGKDTSRYRVVVGSFKNKTEAAKAMEKVQKELPGLNVWVGDRQPNNEFYPVLIDKALSYPDARKLKEQVSELNYDAYLTPYIWR